MQYVCSFNHNAMSLSFPPSVTKREYRSMSKGVCNANRPLCVKSKKKSNAVYHLTRTRVTFSALLINDEAQPSIIAIDVNPLTLLNRPLPPHHHRQHATRRTTHRTNHRI